MELTFLESLALIVVTNCHSSSVRCKAPNSQAQDSAEVQGDAMVQSPSVVGHERGFARLGKKGRCNPP